MMQEFLSFQAKSHKNVQLLEIFFAATQLIKLYSSFGVGCDMGDKSERKYIFIYAIKIF